MQHYVEAKEVYVAIDEEISKAQGQPLGGARAAAAKATVAIPAIWQQTRIGFGVFDPTGKRLERAFGEIQRIDRNRRLWEVVVFLVAVFLAVITGLNALWAPNATWGSIGDIIVAILWGFGLYEINGKVFDGVLKLREDIGKNKAAGGG
jgi:hypothetical protein